MESLLFTIQKFVFSQPPSTEPKSDPLHNLNNEVDVVDITEPSIYDASIPGYFAVSTAPANIEDSPKSNPETLTKVEKAIAQIADHLYQITRNPEITDDPELVITIHGYNTDIQSIQSWYKGVFKYINRVDPVICHRKNSVFLGYRWPSENIQLGSLDAFIKALIAMPVSPKFFLRGGFIFSILMIACILFFSHFFADLIFIILLSISIFLASVILALVILRLVVYFRDVYRATNFGVPDLVELIRNLDKAVMDRTAEVFREDDPTLDHSAAFQKAVNYWNNEQAKRIRLTFIGHSMGGLVVTNTVRILSDVFNSRSIEKQPPASVGYVFCLERLLLASPDIPILTIVSSRANFLASSLRRFAETYLFSSEGDIALRIASTAANYFSFPSFTRSRGYRLGNVALRGGDMAGRPIVQDYGIVNLTSLTHYFEPSSKPMAEALKEDPDNILERLFVTSTSERKGGSNCLSLAELYKEQELQLNGQTSDTHTNKYMHRVTIADLFSFFDCTDYRDTTDRSPNIEMGVLTAAKRKPILSFWDYVQLMLDYGANRRDVHGGYFEGTFSKMAIYQLAFSGFKGLLGGFNSDPQVALTQLHQACQTKGIQLFLSPLRYRADIQGQNVADAKAELIKEILR